MASVSQALWTGLVAAAITLSTLGACGRADLPLNGGSTLGGSGQGGKSGSACGNGKCDANESVQSCEQDCGKCGDGICTTRETQKSCQSDCPPGCGDGYCDPVTESYSCPKDCG